MNLSSSQGQAELWRLASEQLGFSVDFERRPIVDETTIRPTVIVEGFGAPNGMIVVERYDALEGKSGRLVELGYGFSVVRIDKKSVEGQENIRGMLKEWGFVGPDSTRPAWA